MPTPQHDARPSRSSAETTARAVLIGTAKDNTLTAADHGGVHRLVLLARDQRPCELPVRAASVWIRFSISRPVRGAGHARAR